METQLRETFQRRWARYVPGAELPLVLFYADDDRYAAHHEEASGRSCFLGRLVRVREGEDLALSCASFGCHGGRIYSGFPADPMPGFEHFLSCGIPGKIEGERYKKTPALVGPYLEQTPIPEAQGRYLVFRRWDRVEEDETPEVVVFFATPDVLSALFTLVNFGAEDVHAVIAPFCSGCGAIIAHPLAQRSAHTPHAVLGGFDVSARPFLDAAHLSFAVPMALFRRMVEDMDESFLITPAWARVRRRIEKKA